MRYPSDLNDEQWAVVEPLMPRAKRGISGRPPTYARREIVNALLYMARSGCSWRQLPRCFPPYTVVWSHFWRWRDSGALQVIHEAVRAEVRGKEGREAWPSGAILDSQSIKTTRKGGQKAGTATSA